MRGFGVFSIVLFIAGFVGLLAAVFIVVNAENMAGKQAQATAEKVILDLAMVVAENKEIKALLQKSSQQNDAEYQKLMDHTLKVQAEQEKMKHENDKIQHKINWVEVKLNSQSQKPTRIILSQEAPLKVSMIYKKIEPKKKPVTNQTREALLNKTKRQLQELSK